MNTRAASKWLNAQWRIYRAQLLFCILISGQLGEGPIESALTRLLEVTLGGAVAVIVSFIVFPERAHRLAAEAAARVLDEMAKDIPDILAGFFQRADATKLTDIQGRIGRMVSELQGLAEEIKREAPVSFATPDPAPLPRTLLRLRHDFVMMGRASLEPLPVHLSEALRPIVNRVAASIGDYFRGCALTLTSAHKAPPLQPLQDQLDACASQIAELRQRNLANLSASQLEQLFALGFSFDQLRRNINDLERCVQEWLSSRRSVPDKQRT